MEGALWPGRHLLEKFLETDNKKTAESRQAFN